MSHQRIVLLENLRACSYAPFYLAERSGLYAAEGLEVEMQLSPDPAKTAQTLIEGQADVAFGGPMRVMLYHDRAAAAGETCPLVCFGQVVARDPFVLVGARPNPRFRFADLVGPRVAVAIDVPTPWLTLRDDLERAGIDPASLDRAPDASMTDNVDALIRGEVDVIQVFEPEAERLVRQGVGQVWHRFSTRGTLAFTSFYTTRRFASERREACHALLRAITTALGTIRSEAPAALADMIGPSYFPGLASGALARIIENYRGAGLWPASPVLPVSDWVRLKAALLSGGFITRDIAYHEAVDIGLARCDLPGPDRR